MTLSRRARLAFARNRRDRAQLAFVAPDPGLRAAGTKIEALAARGRAPAIYNHAGFVDVGILMGCGTGMRDAYDRPSEPPAAVAPAFGVESAGAPGIAMPRAGTTFAGRVVP